MVFGRRQWHPTPVLLPGEYHGWRSLVGYSPWGHEESDTTEWLHFHFSLSCIGEGNSNPLQCSCLENPRDGGAWWAAVYGVAQSQTGLKQLSSSSSIWYLSFWLTLFSVIIFISIHVAANGIISFFLWLCNIPLHVNICVIIHTHTHTHPTYSLPIHLSVDIYYLHFLNCKWNNSCLKISKLPSNSFSPVSSHCHPTEWWLLIFWGIWFPCWVVS